MEGLDFLLTPLQCPSLPKTDYIELGSGERIAILYEDRTVMAIDKPAGWMLVPVSWQKTDRNLHAAILSSIEERAFWARSRSLRFLQHVHRLDAETSGILLMVKSQGALRPFSQLFESRQLDKRYWAVTSRRPAKPEWTCKLALQQDRQQIGRMQVDNRNGKPAETHFKVLYSGMKRTLLEAQPITGRTHQIRIHAAESGCPIVGDPLYGAEPPQRGKAVMSMGLRAVRLEFPNPFDRRKTIIEAPTQSFLDEFGFGIDPTGKFHSVEK